MVSGTIHVNGFTTNFPPKKLGNDICITECDIMNEQSLDMKELFKDGSSTRV